MVPRGALYFFGGAAAVPPVAAMKSRLAETAAPAPVLPPPPPAAEEESISDDFSVEDFFVDDGAESPGTEAVEKGKGVVFEAAPVGTSFLVAPAPAPAVAAELSDISLPDHDPSEFEWVSLVIDDSLHPPSPGVPPCRLATPTKMLPRVQPPEHRRPVAIPEYRHLSLYRPPPPPPPPQRLCNFSTESHVPIKAKRSKRPQPRRSLSLSDSASSAIYSPSSSSSSGSSFSSSSPPHAPVGYRNAIVLYDGNEHKSSKKRNRKPNRPPRQDVEVTDRRCSHCGSQKTPQWRTGPQGPKTLCNACGVRFKSGRLMPEYRPAASPSFNSHVHANSHRKVMEIRRKKEEHHQHRQYRPVPPPVESY